MRFLFVFLLACYSVQTVQVFASQTKNCKAAFQKKESTFNMPDLIDKKASGKAHSPEELSYIVKAFTEGKIPDYQMSSWLMATRLKGATREETGALTKSMVQSGEVLDFSHLDKPIVDKHSTGGVGDKTSLILAPLCASCGVAVPMISGRGLAHTGGTLDKLESLPGFNVDLSLTEMRKQIKKVGTFISGTTESLVPADKKIYALRDVTSTVNSIPLIAGSIMSKKVAEGLDALVMDIKIGSGANTTPEDAIKLAEELKFIAEYNNVKFRGVMTNMDQPIGRFIGNDLELREILSILKNEIPVEQQSFYNHTKDLSLYLAATMLEVSGKVSSVEEGLKMAKKNLHNGSAFEVFEKMCRAQGTCNLDLPPNPSEQLIIKSPQSGYISEMDTKDIGMASILLGAGKQTKDDVINHDVGIEMTVRLGDAVKAGDPLAIFYYSKDSSDLKKGQEFFIQAIRFSDKKVKTPSMIEGTVK